MAQSNRAARVRLRLDFLRIRWRRFNVAPNDGMGLPQRTIRGINNPTASTLIFRFKSGDEDFTWHKEIKFSTCETELASLPLSLLPKK